MSTTASDTVQLSRRELRLMARRILVAQEAPAGLIPAVADALVAATALHLDPIPRLLAMGESGLLTRQGPLSWTVEADTLRIDGHGGWAPMQLPAIADLLMVLVDRHPTMARVEVVDVADVHLLEALRWRLAGVGLVLQAQSTADAWFLTRGDDVIYREADRALTYEGVATSRETWLAMYRASLLGLEPESEESYKHAGYVGADGELVSGMDDDHDIDAAVRELSVGPS